MFVQLSVAFIVLFVISGIFLPDENLYQSSDGNFYDDQDERKDNLNLITCWRKAFNTLEVTLGLSAALGTILTAVLSFRFSQGRWRGWAQKLHSLFIWENQLKEVTVIKDVAASLEFSTESKEFMCDDLQDVQTADDQSASTVFDEDTPLDVSSQNSITQNSNVDSNFEKNEPSDDKIVTDETRSELSSEEDNTVAELAPPKYSSLEARIITVESSVLRDIDSRMKIFEQQLEEFRIKMQHSDDQSTILPHPQIGLSIDRSLISNENFFSDRQSCNYNMEESKPKASIFLREDEDDSLVKTSNESLNLLSGSDAESERATGAKITKTPEHHNLASTIATRCSRPLIKHGLESMKQKLTNFPARRVMPKPVVPSLRMSEGDGSAKASKESLNQAFVSGGDACRRSNRSSDADSDVSIGNEIRAQTDNGQGSNVTSRNSRPKIKTGVVRRPDSLKRILPGVKQIETTSSPTCSTENVSACAAIRRPAPRSRQQMRAILQHTNEKLSLRKAKTVNKT